MTDYNPISIKTSATKLYKSISTTKTLIGYIQRTCDSFVYLVLCGMCLCVEAILGFAIFRCFSVVKLHGRMRMPGHVYLFYTHIYSMSVNTWRQIAFVQIPNGKLCKCRIGQNTYSIKDKRETLARYCVHVEM